MSSCTAASALTSFYQCGDLYRLDPLRPGHPRQGGLATEASRPTGAFRRTRRSTSAPASCCSSTTARRRRTCTTAWSTPTTTGALHRRPAARSAPAARHGVHRELRHPQRLAAVLGSRAAASGVHLPASTPTCRRGSPSSPAAAAPADIRWFEADPTYVLHFTNAYEEGDEIVLDGFFQGEPPSGRHAGPATVAEGSGSWPWTGSARLHRWRLNLVTGACKEERLSRPDHRVRHDQRAVRGRQHRYTYAATGKPGWFLFDGLVKHDLLTGAEEHFPFGEGVFGSETAMAPRVGSPARTTGTWSRSPPT